MPNVKNLYTLIAREVSTDAADSMNSIIKIIDKFTLDLDVEQVTKDNVPLRGEPIGIPANYAVATSWIFSEKLKEETFYTFRITIFDPSGKKLGGGPEQENLLPANIDKFNMNFNVQGLPVTKEGKYKIESEVLSKDGKTLAAGTYPFEVEFNHRPKE